MTERTVTGLAKRLAVPLLVLTLCAAFWVSVSDLSAKSALYPQLAIVVLVPLTAVQVVVEVWRWAAAPATRQPFARSLRAVWQRRWRPAVTIGLTALLAYVLNLGFVGGFYWSAAVFVGLTLAALGVRNPVALVATAVAYLVVAYVLFTVVLAVPVP